MPTQPISYRKWCKNCQDWKIFTPELGKELVCNICECVLESYRLSEIPVEKLEQQRARWVTQRKAEFRGMLNFASVLADFGSSIGYDNSNLIESDAGQKAIDDQKMADWKTEVARKASEVNKYRSIGRNDLCLCGSQKKYKKCCWNKIQSYK